MKTYKIEVKETLSRIIEIDANSIDEALDDVTKIYKKEEIIFETKSLEQLGYHIDKLKTLKRFNI
jgi:hypothetical protein